MKVFMTKKFILISTIYLIAVLIGCISPNAWIIGACLIILILYPIYKINYLKKHQQEEEYISNIYIRHTIENLKYLNKSLKYLSKN
jgi:hypothetical protein